MTDTRSGRSPTTRRNRTTHNGIEAMISEARPIGTSRSVMKRSEFPPGNRSPIRAAEASSARVSRSALRPRRQTTIPPIRVAAIMKRIAAAKSGGIVSPASSMPR
jgi:hypothetical protein